MSWSVTAEHVPYDHSNNDTLLRLKDEALRQNAECEDQFEAAVGAAVALMNSGSLGPPSHTFRVQMSGHSNPGHGPRAGWANDAITISISQE